MEMGVDVYSAIEIADNAGRTPLFEAVDNGCDPDLLRLLIRKKSKGGFGAKVNIINYNGYTPLYSATREGNLELVQVLVEEGKAKVDLYGGEIEEQQEDAGEEFDSLEEKYFMEAFKSASTPLHVSIVLGFEEIMFYLLSNGANPNLQSNSKGYSCLHIAILSNKPELIIELLTKTTANPHLPDFSGRMLEDMIEMFLPDYLEPFRSLISNLSIERLKQAEGEGAESATVATHYINPDDERQIKGVRTQEEMAQLYNQQQKNESPEKENEGEEQQVEKNPQRRFMEMDESEI